MKITTIHHETIDCKFLDFNGNHVTLKLLDDSEQTIKVDEIVYISES